MMVTTLNEEGKTNLLLLALAALGGRTRRALPLLDLPVGTDGREEQ